MSGELNLQPFRIPLVDPSTGLISREWSKYINQLQVRVGGTTLTPGSDNLVAFITASVAAAVEQLSQQPAPIPVQLPDEVVPQAVIHVSPERIDPAPGNEDLRAQLSEALKRIEALEQRPI